MDTENSAICINTNKILILDSNASHPKETRIAHIPSAMGNDNNGSVSGEHCDRIAAATAPLKVLDQNFQTAQNRDKIETIYPQHHVPMLKALIDANIKLEGFSKKDDPKVLALKQQAELLSSLAVKVNTENTEQSLENAWKVLENFLNVTKDEALKCTVSDVDLHLDQIKDVRQPELSVSPSSSEYSTTSTIMSTNASEQIEQTLSEMWALSEDAGASLHRTGKRA